MVRLAGLLVALAACKDGAPKPKPAPDAARVIAPPAPDARPVSAEPREGARVAAVSLVAEGRIFDEYAVIVPAEKTTKAAIAAVKKAAKARDLRILEGEGVTGGDRYLVGHDWPSPLEGIAANELRAGDLLGLTRALDDEAREAIVAAKRIVHLEMRSERAVLDQALVEIVACAVAGAKAVDGWVMDLRTLEVFEPDMLARLRGDDAPLDARRFTMVQLIALDHLQTAGLRRLGLPELVVRDIPVEAVGGTAFLLYAVTQYLIEQSQLPRDGELDLDLAQLAMGAWPETARAVQRAGGNGTLTVAAVWTAEGQIQLTIPAKSTNPIAGFNKLGLMLGDPTQIDPGGYIEKMRE